MTITLAPAERRHVPDIMRIETSQFPEPWTKGMLLSEIDDVETRRYTVAIENDRLVGYCGVMFVLDEVHVNTIGVLPGDERRGIGRLLLADALAAAAARGCARATLEVAASNTPAQQLYFTFGFAPVGARKRYYERSGEDALVLWADLPAPPTPTISS